MVAYDPDNMTLIRSQTDDAYEQACADCELRDWLVRSFILRGTERPIEIDIVQWTLNSRYLLGEVAMTLRKMREK